MDRTQDVLAAMIEVELALTAARDEATKEASAHVSNNDSYQFLLGASIGLDRALRILHGRVAALKSDAATATE